MLAPGQILGPYELLHLLGEGRTSQVFAAWDAAQQRAVAIKALRPEVYCLKPDVGLRFLDEALPRRLPGFHHPGVLTTFTTEWPQVGVPYHVMERMDGSLAVLLAARGALPLGQVLRLGIQVAQALAALHRQGVVHQDLHPGHLLLRGEGAEQVVKLADFGRALLGDHDGAADLRALARVLARALGDAPPPALAVLLARMDGEGPGPGAAEVAAALEAVSADEATGAPAAPGGRR